MESVIADHSRSASERPRSAGGIPLAAAVLGLLLAAGLAGAAWLGGQSLLTFKRLDRSVEVKGLSEREVPADLAIWPIGFVEADNDVGNLYRTIERKTARLVEFLKQAGFKAEEIGASAPTVVDKQAREYGGDERAQFRFTGRSTVTVYTADVARVRATMNRLGELGREGFAIGGEHGAQTQFLFTGLNAIKPEMIEEATRNAREAATKFAEDSGSHLGKIRRASQGQFSIGDRDASTPHIKKIRVVSTVEYYLAD
ncbi:SIMPL domain-containing protein [Burkholderiaceae bacterium FT117]|uniref:SIMPL domain-containing protein n=1 Tax=Zeimonas sediminis TaxID=2944268 RepID=UPI002342ED29|nr:SIMPL domain-containing protein [Zeimonas sediminis]MCM5569462.1 SIMPL domain-containing protein [Zeimonas sediminis]